MDAKSMRLKGPSFVAFIAGTMITPAVVQLHVVPLASFRAAWTREPTIVLPLLFMLGAYLLGATRALEAARRNVSSSKAISFLLGWFTLALALLSPLHDLSESLFSAHMLQHELLMVVAAPLLVAGRPDLIYCLGASDELAEATWPISARRHNNSGMAPAYGSDHGMALAWHRSLDMAHPCAFRPTLSHGWIHAAQHISFLGTALLFWGILLYGHVGKRSYGAGILYLFTTAIHTSILGALLTFASFPWYFIYQHTAAFWGVSPLEDQQLGGLIMWVPASVTYIIAGLWLLAGWIRESDRLSSFGSVQAIVER